MARRVAAVEPVAWGVGRGELSAGLCVRAAGSGVAGAGLVEVRDARR